MKIRQGSRFGLIAIIILIGGIVAIVFGQKIYDRVLGKLVNQKDNSNTAAIATMAPAFPTDNASLPIEITDEKGVKMEIVPNGVFIMGGINGSSDERPVHNVYLDAFYIDKFDVTNGLYEACVMNKGCQSADGYSDFYGVSAYGNYPVLVSWDMAKAYCKWRGSTTFLPTEAEWEKAARGTDGRTYPWGEEDPEISFAGIFPGQFLANYGNENFLSNPGDDAIFKNDSTPVGTFESDRSPLGLYNIDGKSPYGLYDMAGNVWQFVADWYSFDYYSSSPSSNPIGPSTGKFHVMRGGSFKDAENMIRTFTRMPYNTTDGEGFRCAHSIP